jgi:hypothetical protein
VFRSRKRDDFTGGPVAARQYLAACDALLALGLLYQSRSIRYGIGVWDVGDPESFLGKAPRLWPTQVLLDIVGRHGLTPATLAEDFEDVYPTQPPPVPEPIQVFALKRPRRAEKVPMVIRRGDPDATRLRNEIAQYNEWVGQHEITGCLPPRFKRVFTSSWLLGGRWYAVGNEGVYQRMSEAERLRITINGEPVVEADVRASHLSIMLGLLGLPLPEGDPYEFTDVPRSVAKAWITATLGKGSPVKRWAVRAGKDSPELLDADPKQVGEVICGRYPFLRRPAEAVADAAGLRRLDKIGAPARLLTHRLMAIEARALTGAMDYLRAPHGVLALPMHDGLLLPQSGAGHVGAGLDSAYSYFAGRVRIRWTIRGPADMPVLDSRRP